MVPAAKLGLRSSCTPRVNSVLPRERLSKKKKAFLDPWYLPNSGGPETAPFCPYSASFGLAPTSYHWGLRGSYYHQNDRVNRAHLLHFRLRAGPPTFISDRATFGGGRGSAILPARHTHPTCSLAVPSGREREGKEGSSLASDAQHKRARAHTHTRWTRGQAMQRMQPRAPPSPHSPPHSSTPAAGSTAHVVLACAALHARGAGIEAAAAH